MLNGMASPPIASLIDELLEKDKELGGVPDWREMHAHGQHRLVVPALLDGASTGMDLEVHAYPDIKPLRFGVMLNVRECVWRIDYAEDDQHVNSFDAPPDIAGIQIDGPHYHAWDDNRRFCTHASLPRSLPNARFLPMAIRSFDSALRWLCGEAHIAQPRAGLIELPPRTRLI